MNSRVLAPWIAAVFAAGVAVTSAQAEPKEVTVYKSPQCGCCGGWVEYMQKSGYSVRVKEMDDVTPIKEFLRINEDLWSCHTAVIDGYVVEGHATLAAIEKLLKEHPKDVRGIALPGMPQGSPGMSGTKDEAWVTYTISDRAPEKFLVE